jgi:hypothetical protein
MISAQKERKTLTLTVSLTNADHEWLTEFAELSGKSLDEAVSFGLSGWLKNEGWILTEMLGRKATRTGAPARRVNKKRLARVLMFPSRF